MHENFLLKFTKGFQLEGALPLDIAGSYVARAPLERARSP